MAEPQVSTLKMGVRISLAAPRFVEYLLISNGGKTNVTGFGYHVVPVYKTLARSLKHKNNMQWIEEGLSDSWTWFVFGGYPEAGISYCFKSKIDAGMFLLCKCSHKDGLHYV